MSILEIQESQIGLLNIARITFSFFVYCFSSVQYIKDADLHILIVNLPFTIGGKLHPVMSALFEMIIDASWWERYKIQLA